MDRFLLRRTGAECTGVFFPVLAACGSVMIGGLTGAYGHLGMTFSAGLVVKVMVAATGHLSMAHLNPAVTLAFALSGHFSWREVPYYVVGQLVAAALGAAVLRLMFGTVSTLGANLPSGPIAQSLVTEALVTAGLMLVIVAVATDRRAKGLPAGPAIGATVALNVLWSGPISGASMNPARSFGPVLISGVWTAHWICWVGPIIGAAQRIRLRVRAQHRTRRCLIPPGSVRKTGFSEGVMGLMKRVLSRAGPPDCRPPNLLIQATSWYGPRFPGGSNAAI